MGDRIKLNLPAKPEYILTIRMAVSAIATRLNFDIDDIVDLKAGASEACTMFLNSPKPPEIFDITITIAHDFMVEICGEGEKTMNYHGIENKEAAALSECLIKEFYDHSNFIYDGEDLKRILISKKIDV